MIPKFNQSGVLPPFLPNSTSAIFEDTSPYRITMLELVRRFAISDERRKLLHGLIQYRRALRDAGFVDGFQWIDGSFTEDCEANRKRPPSDIDLVSFLHRPETYRTEDDKYSEFFYANVSLFDKNKTKPNYHCDAFYVDLDGHPLPLVSNTRYWFGLFSHQRDTYLWKGMLELQIQDDDESAIQLLEQLLEREVQHDS